MHPRSQVAQDCSHRQYFLESFLRRCNKSCSNCLEKESKKVGWKFEKQITSIYDPICQHFFRAVLASVISGPVVFYSLLQLHFSNSEVDFQSCWPCEGFSREGYAGGGLSERVRNWHLGRGRKRWNWSHVQSIQGGNVRIRVVWVLVQECFR